MAYRKRKPRPKDKPKIKIKKKYLSNKHRKKQIQTRSVPGKRLHLRDPFWETKHPQGCSEMYTVEQVAEALRKTAGIYSRASRYLAKKTGRGSGDCGTVSRYVDKYPFLKDVKAEVDQGTCDLAEDKLLKAIKNENRRDHMRAVTFYLITKGKKRGFSTRSEVTGADGEPLNPPTQQKLDLSQLSDEELNQFESLCEKASKKEDETGPSLRRGNGHAPGSFNGKDRDSGGKVPSLT